MRSWRGTSACETVGLLTVAVPGPGPDRRRRGGEEERTAPGSVLAGLSARSDENHRVTS